MSNKAKEVKDKIISLFKERIEVTNDLVYIRYFVDFDKNGIEILSSLFGEGIFEDVNFDAHSYDSNSHLAKLQIDKKTAEVANRLLIEQSKELFEDPEFAKKFVVKALVLERKKKDEGHVKQKLNEFVQSLYKKVEKRLNPVDRHVKGADNISEELEKFDFDAKIPLAKIFNDESTLIIAGNKNYTIKTPEGLFVKLNVVPRHGKKK